MPIQTSSHFICFTNGNRFTILYWFQALLKQLSAVTSGNIFSPRSAFTKNAFQPPLLQPTRRYPFCFYWRCYWCPERSRWVFYQSTVVGTSCKPYWFSRSLDGSDQDWFVWSYFNRRTIRWRDHDCNAAEKRILRMGMKWRLSKGAAPKKIELRKWAGANLYFWHISGSKSHWCRNHILFAFWLRVEI